jgi:hypothetical protein
VTHYRFALYALFGLIVGGLVGFALGRGTDFDFEGTAPGGYAVKLKVDGEEMDYGKAMSALFSDSFMVGAARTWLAEREQMWSLSDERLAGALESSACADIDIPDHPLRLRLDSLRVCAEKEGNRLLRELAFTRRGVPFHPVGLPTMASVPANQPPRGRVYVCNRNFVGRRLQLIHAERDTSIFVGTGGLISDCSSVHVNTELHLNDEDAAALFGIRPFRGIDTVYVALASASGG